MSIILGVTFHALGGLASGSFYLPYKRIQGWAWESYWLVGGVMSWLLAPLILAYFTIPHLFKLLTLIPTAILGWTYLWGVLWGLGGLTFGLAMRYLGLSLGMAVTLGLCAVFGTLVPPIWEGRLVQLLATMSGRCIMLGLGVCVVGILLCGQAGRLKEKSLTQTEKQATIQEFDLSKGMLVAVFSGIMSACMAFGLTAGQPIAHLAIAQGANPLFSNNAILVIILWGGLTTNAAWCLFLNYRNRTFSDYRNPTAPALRNTIFCAIAGLTWYFQFFFYGMGDSQMDAYRFSGWTLHMAFIIVFSSFWGLYLNEWHGASRSTMRTVSLGILAVILSTVIIGYGNYLAS
jgi:L-rhamnose-H+ transport protein